MIGSLLGGIGGGITSLLTKGGEDEPAKARDIIAAVQRPDFNWSTITPAELQIVAQWDPQTYEAVVPQEVKVGNDSPELRAAQAQGLAQLRTVAQEGLPVQERIAAQEAGRATESAQRGALNSAMRNLQARGQTGGGQEAMMRVGSGQVAANYARDRSNDLSRMAVENRLNALGQSNALAGQIRQQDYGVSADQANTYNNFYRWLAEYQTAPKQYASQVGNAANQWNAQNQQNTANWNTQNRQQTQESNLNRENQLKGNLSEFDLEKARALAGQINIVGQAKDAEKAAKVKAVAGIGQGIGGIADIYGGGGSSGGLGYGSSMGGMGNFYKI